MCIKLVSIKELYYDARPTKSQDSYDRSIVSSKAHSENVKNALSEQCCVLIKVRFIEFRPTDALALWNNRLNLREFDNCEYAEKKFSNELSFRINPAGGI